MTLIFQRFFVIWARFWEAPETQKINKNRKNRVQDGFGTCLGSSIDFGHDFGAILIDLGRILDGFWKDFGKIFGGI